MIETILIFLISIELFVLFYILFKWKKEQYELEISKRDKTVNFMMNIIKQKNLQIKELQSGSKERNNKRL